MKIKNELNLMWQQMNLFLSFPLLYFTDVVEHLVLLSSFEVSSSTVLVELFRNIVIVCWKWLLTKLVDLSSYLWNL